MTAVVEPGPEAPELAPEAPDVDAPDSGGPPPPPRADGPPPVNGRELAVLVIGTLVLAAAVVGTRWGVFTPDTRPDLYQNPGAFVRSTVQAWVGGATGLGQGNFNAGAAPVGAVVWVIRTLGAPAWMAVRIWRLLVILLGAWGLRRYLGALMGRRLSVQARVIGTIFWVVNPYVIVAGSTTPILLPYALLPWTLLAFLRATRSPRSWRWPALFALAFFAQTGLNAGVVPFFALLALPAHLAHARWVEGRAWRDLVRVVVRCAALSVAVSLYWLLPSFLATGTGAGIAATTESPIDVARTSSYSETARGLGNWPLYGRAGNREFLGDYTIYLTNGLVLAATFLIPFLVGVSLWRSRARERLLVVGLLAIGLPVMVGMFPPDDPYPAGRLLNEIFERVPAALAFRTTNKVGAVVVLAETIALVFGWRTWEARTRQRGWVVRSSAVAVVAVLLLAISAPLWNGGLYPLGYKIPRSWQQATANLDDVRSGQRVLVVPGGTGGNYRWGMRSPDDLFPSLLARPVAVRSTVVGRGDPAGNFLSAFDLAMAQGALSDAGTSTTARYLGAGDVLLRNDLLTEEIGGAAPWIVHQQVANDPGLVLANAYGTRGTDTVPGQSGRATKTDRTTDPKDARLPPVMAYRVVDPTPPITAAAASDQVLAVGDAGAMPALIQAGIVDGSQPVRYLGDLDQAAFAKAVREGGRVVLTDTNRRRAWDINRVANATSATLTVDDDIDAGNGATTTRWPDQPADQTVSVLTGEEGVQIGASRDGFGLHPYGRPTNAFDGDEGTAWLTGGFRTAVGKSIWIEFPEARRITDITIRPSDPAPSTVDAVLVRVGDKEVRETLSAGVDTKVSIEPSTAKRVQVTILSQTSGSNPVGISEITVDDTEVRNVTRAPETLTRLADQADAATGEALAEMPLDVIFTRAQGSIIDGNDDEEAQLDRIFELPDDRTFSFAASLSSLQVSSDTLDEARRGITPCTRVALLDDEWLEARIVSTTSELAAGTVRLEGCAPVELDAGEHELQTVFGWRLDTVRFASEVQAAATPSDPTGSVVTVGDRSATKVEMDVPAASGPRYLRLGEAFDDRWTLTVDGVDAGPPILVDGYSTGWKIDGDAHHLVASFGPQRAVQATFVASALAVSGVTAVALLPVPPALVARRRRRSGAPGASGPVGSSEGGAP